MTPKSTREYADAIRGRYLKASKEEKGKILDEFTKVSGYHRKSAIRLLRLKIRPKRYRKRGRPGRYSRVVEALRVTWEASDHLCSKRLKPFLPELVPILMKHGAMVIDSETKTELCRMSASTIDRLLRPYRRSGGRRPLSTTKPGSLLKSSIPIRTFTEWEEKYPGYLEVDLVSHCGESTAGFYLNTLSTVDIATGWSECVGVWGKGQERVGAAIHRVRQRLPFSLRGLDSDNGTEFINKHLFEYCRREDIKFTRSRSYKKNDSCHVEQKNWSVVRRVIGYDRYNSRPALEVLNRVYSILRLYVNFLQPVMKLVNKTRQGAKVHKVYDLAQTPYQRLLKSGILTEARRIELTAVYSGLNPVLLLKQLNDNLASLWRLKEHPEGQKRINKVTIR